MWDLIVSVPDHCLYFYVNCDFLLKSTGVVFEASVHITDGCSNVVYLSVYPLVEHIAHTRNQLSDFCDSGFRASGNLHRESPLMWWNVLYIQTKYPN